MTKKPQGQALGGGCLALFGIPFLLAGLFVCWLGLSRAMVFWRSRTWVPVPAMIEKIEIQESTDSEGDTTYALRGEYRFDFGGRTYRNSRIEVDEDFRSMRRRLDGMFAVLDKHRQLKKPIDALVNPHNPDESLIFREFSHMMLIFPLFGLVFTIVGAGITGGGVLNIISSRRAAALVQKFPDQPWKWEGHWEGCRTSNSSLWIAVTTFFATLGGNAFIWVFILATFIESDLPDIVPWIFAGLGLIGLASFLIPIGQFRHYWRYGSPVLLFERVPVSPGECLRVVLLVQSKLVTTAGIVATLYCNELREESDGDGTTTVTVNRLTEIQTVHQDLNRSTGRSAIPITFQIPDNQPSR
ncbi:MAG TPA: DUF3592 domain-containing protein, partial [Candidatus Ozemobacteraceae bacterium]|nr:DUF3592 domain-containing protein [Candidatus Ozemobacteraceae bacterium]